MLALSFVSGFSIGASYRKKAVCEASDGPFVASAVKSGAAYLVPGPPNFRPQTPRCNQNDKLDVSSGFGDGNASKRDPSETRPGDSLFWADSVRNVGNGEKCEDKVDENTYLINRSSIMDRDAVFDEKFEKHTVETNIPSENGAIDWILGSCGDGRIDFNEECDDGNQDPTDACVRCKRARCGDGHLWLKREECDRGSGLTASKCDELLPEIEVYNPNERTGCTSKCELDFDTCRFCGDRIIQADFGEKCDGAVGCVELALAHDVYPDPAKQATCGERCKTMAWKECPRCGDSMVDLGWGEECDDGNNDSSDGCDSCVLTRDGEAVACSSTPFNRKC